MKLKMKRGTTSKLLRLFLEDTTATDGSGLTGLTNTSPGLAAYYIREGDSTPTQITLAAGTVGTWASGGFKEVDATNLPGLYELGLPNAALASGASVTVMARGAANMAMNLTEIELDGVDYQSGLMLLDLTQAIPTANTAQTVGDALNAARAQGFGKWSLSGTTLTLYAPDGTTVVRTFTLDNSVSPTTRT